MSRAQAAFARAANAVAGSVHGIGSAAAGIVGYNVQTAVDTLSPVSISPSPWLMPMPSIKSFC
jgi:hypothetical protein